MTLGDIAPYPTSEEEATTEAMIRYLLVRAQAIWHRALTVDPDAEQLSGAANLYGLVSLLDALAHLVPHVGDEAARELWATWEEPLSLGVSIWNDLKQLGVDPDQVNRIADEQAKAAAK